MADLAGQVKNHILALDQCPHRVRVAHVGNVHTHAPFVACQVEAVAAIVGDQRIDNRHARTEIGQAAGEIRADKTKAAGDQYGRDSRRASCPIPRLEEALQACSHHDIALDTDTPLHKGVERVDLARSQR